MKKLFLLLTIFFGLCATLFFAIEVTQGPIETFTEMATMILFSTFFISLIVGIVCVSLMEHIDQRITRLEQLSQKQR